MLFSSYTNFISITKIHKENPAGYWKILQKGMLRLLMKSQGFYALQTEYQTMLYFPQARSLEFKEFSLSIFPSINLHKTRESLAFWLFNYDLSNSVEITHRIKNKLQYEWFITAKLNLSHTSCLLIIKM